jgi:hypothetical protein
MTFRLVDQNLGGFGSELRTTARIGYMTNLSAEYYRRLVPSGYYLEPRAGILRASLHLVQPEARRRSFSAKSRCGPRSQKDFFESTANLRRMARRGDTLEPHDKLWRRPIPHRNRADRSAAHQH